MNVDSEIASSSQLGFHYGNYNHYEIITYVPAPFQVLLGTCQKWH